MAMLIAEAVVDLFAFLWTPPGRLIGETWRRFRRRSAPLRALGILLCTLVAIASLTIYLGLLALLVLVPVWLVRSLG